MQITESLTKDGFPSMDSDYRVQSSTQGQFGQQQNSNADGSSSTLKPPLFNRADEILQNKVSSADGDSSNKQIPGFMSPPQISHPTPRPTPAKTNMRSNTIEIVRSEYYKKHFVHSTSSNQFRIYIVSNQMVL